MMIKKKRVRKKIGDVIEVSTSKGLTYVQYTHEHNLFPIHGSLVRVLEGFYKTRLSEEKLEVLVKKPHRFSTFSPVHHAVNNWNFELVGNFPVPEFAQKFPIFKGTNSPSHSDPNKVTWWLWDGEKEWKVGNLSRTDQAKYPNRVVDTAAGLVHSIETGVTATGIEHC